MLSLFRTEPLVRVHSEKTQSELSLQVRLVFVGLIVTLVMTAQTTMNRLERLDLDYPNVRARWAPGVYYYCVTKPIVNYMSINNVTEITG